jgi:DNA-binding transcriptional regulator LsrR (DeoR family)
MATKNPEARQISDSSSVRLRAAWLYHNQRLTQSEVAKRLGVSRATVIRLLHEAEVRNEVHIWINTDVADCLELSIKLERVFGLDRAIVVPIGPDAPDVTAAVGSVLGRYLSETIVDGMTVGVGWGRTLTAALRTFVPSRQPATQIAALMGGVINPGRDNPIEFSWRLASSLGAECYLYLAPVIVDSPQTKQTLLEDCGLKEIISLATGLDMAVVSCGDIGPDGSSLANSMIGDTIMPELIDRGAICDVMCNFIDPAGHTVEHEIAGRTMSVDLDVLSTARNLVLATGGAHRAAALLAAIRRMSPQTLITDEAAAIALLERASVDG